MLSKIVDQYRCRVSVVNIKVSNLDFANDALLAKALQFLIIIIAVEVLHEK